MFNGLFKSTVIAGLMCLTTTVSWAECPNTTIECLNGVKQKVNTKWSWHTAKCEPMHSDGGDSLDKAISACEAISGGVKEHSLKDGISVGLIVERATKIGIIVGKAVYKAASAQKKSDGAQPSPSSSSSATSMSSAIISKIPSVIKEIGSAHSNTSNAPSNSGSAQAQNSTPATQVFENPRSNLPASNASKYPPSNSSPVTSESAISQPNKPTSSNAQNPQVSSTDPNVIKNSWNNRAYRKPLPSLPNS